MGFLTTPLDDALSSTSKIRLLRLLVEQDRMVSAREASRLTQMSRPAITRAIDDLTALGLITREQSGRQYLCRINRAHRLVESALRPLFAAEATWPDFLFGALRELLAGSRAAVSAAWIFGSAATGQDKPGSDFDLFVISPTAEDADRVAAHIADAGSPWQSRFGIDLRPVVMTLDKAMGQYREGSPLLRAAVKDARFIVGELPAQMRHG